MDGSLPRVTPKQKTFWLTLDFHGKQLCRFSCKKILFIIIIYLYKNLWGLSGPYHYPQIMLQIFQLIKKLINILFSQIK